MSSHSSEEWVLALAARSLEVVHGYVPDHASHQSLLLDVLHLVLDRLQTVVPDPLVSLVGIGSDNTVTSFHLLPALVLQVQADLGVVQFYSLVIRSL